MADPTMLVATVALTGMKVDLNFPEGAIRCDFINSAGAVVQSGGLDGNNEASMTNPPADTYTAKAVYVDGQGNELAGTTFVSEPFVWPPVNQKTIQVPSAVTLSAR